MGGAPSGGRVGGSPNLGNTNRGRAINVNPNIGRQSQGGRNSANSGGSGRVTTPGTVDRGRNAIGANPNVIGRQSQGGRNNANLGGSGRVTTPGAVDRGRNAINVNPNVIGRQPQGGRNNANLGNRGRVATPGTVDRGRNSANVNPNVIGRQGQGQRNDLDGAGRIGGNANPGRQQFDRNNRTDGGRDVARRQQGTGRPNTGSAFLNRYGLGDNRNLADLNRGQRDRDGRADRDGRGGRDWDGRGGRDWDGRHYRGDGHRHYVAHGGRYYPRNSFFFGTRSPFGYYSNPGFYRSYYRRPYNNFGWVGLLGPLFGYSNVYPYGYGYGYPYGNYGYSSYDPGYGYGYSYNPTYVTVYEPIAELPPVLAADAPPPVEVAAEEVDPLDAGVLDFAAQGEADFKAGRYDEAVKNWQHALVDDPQNAALLLLMGQALFATEKFDQAAGTIQRALGVLPQDKWGVVVQNYTELYGDPGDYSKQLKALEAARKTEPEQPALRFLLGYHYAFLDYPREALRELDKLLEVAPKDEIGKKLHDAMSAKVGGAAPLQPAAP